MLSADTRKGGTFIQSWPSPSSENASLPPLNIEGAKSTRFKYLKLAEINLCFLPPVESLLFLHPNSPELPTTALLPHAARLSVTAMRLPAAGTHAGPCSLFFFRVCSSQPIATALVLFNDLKHSLRSCITHCPVSHACA